MLSAMPRETVLTCPSWPNPATPPWAEQVNPALRNTVNPASQIRGNGEKEMPFGYFENEYYAIVCVCRLGEREANNVVIKCDYEKFSTCCAPLLNTQAEHSFDGSIHEY
jgi:hypothetical protein